LSEVWANARKILACLRYDEWNGYTFEHFAEGDECEAAAKDMSDMLEMVLDYNSGR